MDNTRRQLSFDELTELVEKAEGWVREPMMCEVSGHQFVYEMRKYRRKDGVFIEIGRDSAGRGYINRGKGPDGFEPFLEGDALRI